MESSPFTLFLLDTNILIHAVRGSITWQTIKVACNPLMVEPRPIYSIVTEAELLSFAEQQSWSAIRREQTEYLLSYFDRIGIEDRKIIQSYVAIDTYSRKMLQGSKKMGKNDLWIAATAYAVGATIVTTDTDFEHLHGTYLNRILI